MSTNLFVDIMAMFQLLDYIGNTAPKCKNKIHFPAFCYRACYFFPSRVGIKNKYGSHTHQHTSSTEISFSNACRENRGGYFENETGITDKVLSQYDPSYLTEQLAAFVQNVNRSTIAKIQKFRQCSMQKCSPSVLSDAEVPRPVSPLSAVPGRRPKRLWNFSDTAGVCHSMSANRANVYVNENHTPTEKTSTDSVMTAIW